MEESFTKMKKLNVLYNGKKLCQIYPHATWFEVIKWKTGRLIRKTIIWAFIAGLVVSAFHIGSTFFGEVSYASVEKIVEVPTKAPVLDRISMCESGGKHYDKNGQVLINATKDMGVFQINVPIHGKKATEMGLNLAIEKDNRTYAQYLYENFGTEPWIHSKKCWNK